MVYIISDSDLLLDISENNIALGVSENAFSPKVLEETFQFDRKIYVILKGVPEPEAHTTRPANLPEYIIEHMTPLSTNTTDLSLVDIIDFGKGL